MNIRWVHRSLLLFAAVLVTISLLASCTSRGQVEKALPGLWEGELGNGFSWCVNYGNDSQLSVTTYRPLFLRDDNGEILDAFEVIENRGQWQLSKGLRIFHNTTRVSKVKVLAGVAVPEDDPPTLQLVRKGYIIKNVTDELMHYRSQTESSSWFTSKRVQKCSEKFTP